MRQLAFLFLLLIVVNGSASAGVVAPTALSRVLSRSGGISSIEFIQEKRKSDTITERVKRAWKDLVGYKFDVSCPIFYHTTCTETGKDRADARAKCISRNPFCYVTDASR
jgi:hypothetical protein